MRILLLEGNEGTGKTSLAQQLWHSAINGAAAIEHCTATPCSPFTYYTELFRKHKQKGVELLIFDRGWYSDVVYSEVLRNEPEEKLEMLHAYCAAIEAAAISGGSAAVMYLYTRNTTGYKRAKARGEDLIKDVDTWREINNAFEKYLKACTLPVIRVDTTDIK